MAYCSLAAYFDILADGLSSTVSLTAKGHFGIVVEAKPLIGKGKVMRDEIYDREYQAGRAELHAGIDRAVLCLGRFLAATFDTLNAIQWAAPWREPRRRAGKHPGTA